MMTNKKKMVALQNLCPQAQGDDFDDLHSSIVDKANKVQLRKLCMHVTPSGKRSEALYQKFAKASKEELQAMTEAKEGEVLPLLALLRALASLPH